MVIHSEAVSRGLERLSRAFQTVQEQLHVLEDRTKTMESLTFFKDVAKSDLKEFSTHVLYMFGDDPECIERVLAFAYTQHCNRGSQSLAFKSGEALIPANTLKPKRMPSLEGAHNRTSVFYSTVKLKGVGAPGQYGYFRIRQV